MLLGFGIFSQIYANRKPSGMKKMPDSNRQPKEYYCQASHDLIITRQSYDLFFKEIAFLTDYQNQKYINTTDI